MALPDVVIVGTGLAGSATAWHLSAHFNVLLLEQGKLPGQEATAQNAGMVRRMGEDPCERALALRTVEFLENLPGGFPSQTSRRTGAIIGLARDPHLLTDAAAHLEAAGVELEQCDRPAALAPALADAPLNTAWYLPGERVVNASHLLEGFLTGARKSNAEIRTSCRVHQILVEHGRVIGVQTDRGPIHAQAVVLAAGAWCSGLATTVGLNRQLVPLRRALFRSREHALATEEHPWCWVDDVGVYVRPDRGTWLFSPCDELPEAPAVQPGSTGSTNDSQQALVHNKIGRHLPALSDLSVDYGWSGLRTFAPDRRPLIGEDPEAAGLWWAAGLGGFGVTCSYGVGEVLAHWMQDRPTPWLDPRSVCPGRPQSSRFLVRYQGDLHKGRLSPAPLRN